MIDYIIIRILIFPISLLPFRAIHFLGKILGTLAFYFLPKFRKRTLSNITLASSLTLSKKQIRKVAIQSFQNLMITVFEYGKFSRVHSIKKHIICENPRVAKSLIDNGQGVIFFCGHQANWEVLFLDGNLRMPGVAIGRPIKNKYLYKWIISIREKFGGTIIEPKDGLRGGLKALKSGKFLGIVGDQGMPETGYLSKFLGRSAYTSPAPAILSHRTNSPIIVATTRREKGKYYIHYSEPIYPDTKKTLKEEMPRLMDLTLGLFEKSVIKRPQEWLWQHNRFKQETPRNVYYRFRHESILIILDKKCPVDLQTFRKIYPKAFLTLLIPENTAYHLENAKVITYKNPEDILIDSYEYKCVFNLTNQLTPSKFYKKRSAFEVINLDDLNALNNKKHKNVLLGALARDSLIEEVNMENAEVTP